MPPKQLKKKLPPTGAHLSAMTGVTSASSIDDPAAAAMQQFPPSADDTDPLPATATEEDDDEYSDSLDIMSDPAEDNIDTAASALAPEADPVSPLLEVDETVVKLARGLLSTGARNTLATVKQILKAEETKFVNKPLLDASRLCKHCNSNPPRELRGPVSQKRGYCPQCWYAKRTRLHPDIKAEREALQAARVRQQEVSAAARRSTEIKQLRKRIHKLEKPELTKKPEVAKKPELDKSTASAMSELSL